MKLYFAYGSNMDREQMDERCPGHERLGWAVLRGYFWYLTSRTYASIRKSPGDYVEGFLYRITKTDEQELDYFEGVANGLYEKHYIPMEHNGKRLENVLVYIDPETREGEPQDWYVTAINQGISDAQLTATYVNKYIRPFIRPPSTPQPRQR